MRTLSITLVALAISAGVLAQEQFAPPGTFVAPLVPPRGVPGFFKGNVGTLPRTLVAPPPAASPQSQVLRCAIPLIEMKAPKGVDPRIQVAPNLDSVEKMSQAKLPPVCEVSPAR